MSLSSCLEGFNGFARLAGSERPPAPEPVALYESMRTTEWVELINQIPNIVPEIGCLFTSRASVYGAGQVCIDGQLVVQDIGLSQVSLDWHRRSFGVSEIRQSITINDPVISFVGPGHKVYGHWIVDFLPRLYVARRLLGPGFGNFHLLLPDDTPSFALELCRLLIDPTVRVIYYDHANETVVCTSLCIPTYPQSQNHHFHSIVDELFSGVRAAQSGNRKICISRRLMEATSISIRKSFQQLDLFESTALSLGYELAYPEQLTFEKQFELFRGARVIVGEFGSGMHNSVFAAAGTVVGVAGFFSEIQLRLCGMSRQRSFYVIPESEGYVDGVLKYSCDPAEIAGFFAAIEDFLASEANAD